MVHLKILGTVGDDTEDGGDRYLGQHVPVRKCRGRQLKISRKMRRNVECISVVPSKVRLQATRHPRSVEVGVREAQEGLTALPFDLTE